MADMGFLPDVERLLDLTPADRQTLLFSATLDGDIDVLVRRYQNDPARHELEVDEDDINAAVHLFWKVASGDRIDRTATSSRQRDRRSCSAAPSTAPTGSPASWSNAASVPRPSTATAARSSGRRPWTCSSAGPVDTLVATDVAARGIHVDGVNAVVHFDPPADAKDYVHRSGRTARAGATGVVVSFVTPDKAAAVKSLQRHLDVPMGTTVPDMASITAVLGEPPKRRPGQDRAPEPRHVHGGHGSCAWGPARSEPAAGQALEATTGRGPYRPVVDRGQCPQRVGCGQSPQRVGSGSGARLRWHVGT